MKKILFILVVIFLATTLMAGTDAKLVRLEVINASGDTVYIKLNGKTNGEFYYLTIPDGETKTFTVVSDVYDRVTWACGLSNKGTLQMTSNNRLKFTKCNTFPANSGEPTMEKVVYFPFTYGWAPFFYRGCGDYKVITDIKSLFNPPYNKAFVFFVGTARFPSSWWSYWFNNYKQGCYWRYRY